MMNASPSAELSNRLRQWRHHLHQHPEPAFQERETAQYLEGVLKDVGVEEVVPGVGGTGIVATLARGTGKKAIGLRADMDCLPLHEAGSRAHASRNAGAMHACGHDGHMAMVLGAAALLADQGGFDGTVRFIFQPAEEPGRGAQAMIDDGLFDRFPIDAIFGLHNTPGLAVGELGTRTGALLASEDNFEIRICGRGGHAASPHMVVDPLVIGAEVVLALQTIVARNIDPSQSAVVSCTQFETDGARNAIPSGVVIRGDTRSFTDEVRDLLERRIREIAEGICGSYGATCQVTYTHEFDPTVNDSECVGATLQAAAAVLGREHVDSDHPANLSSEDFGVFARHVPGCFAFIGNGTEPDRGGDPLHSVDYDFNDDVLDLGVQYYVALIRTLLPEG
ncbi:M20 aminoacylase family protein [Streptomyces albidoflavus]|uniref:M20 aminoacylase family protein n=1 Tax=Streptomyces albidoflavus TaxID=1886 RepID=UPI000AFE8D50|nr:M20 aminoacylase family protein [Streptomyces albidoflavus]